MRGSVRETERDAERDGERALGAERGGPGGEGARTAPLGARPGPARLGSARLTYLGPLAVRALPRLGGFPEGGRHGCDGGSERRARERASTRGARAGTGGARGQRSEPARAPARRRRVHGDGGNARAAPSAAPPGPPGMGEHGRARPPPPPLPGQPRGASAAGPLSSARSPPAEPPFPPQPPLRNGAHPAAGRTGSIAAGPARCPRCWRRRSASRRPSAVLGGHRPRAAPGPAPGRAPRSRLRSSAELSRVCPAPGHRERQRGPGTPSRWVGPGRVRSDRAGPGREALPAVAPQPRAVRAVAGVPRGAEGKAPCPRCRLGSEHPRDAAGSRWRDRVVVCRSSVRQHDARRFPRGENRSLWAVPLCQKLRAGAVL